MLISNINKASLKGKEIKYDLKHAATYRQYLAGNIGTHV